ncbi:hypothetical protein DA11_20620 [Aeromonas caviae]|nr:hypothetical protein DA11_20620 [Aeromonas caviae]
MNGHEIAHTSDIVGRKYNFFDTGIVLKRVSQMAYKVIIFDINPLRYEIPILSGYAKCKLRTITYADKSR